MDTEAADWGVGLGSLTESIQATGGLACRRKRQLTVQVDKDLEVESPEAVTTAPLSPKSCSSPGLSISTAKSQARYGDPDQSLLFLDWDDTLFPTTEVFDRWQIPSKPDLWDDIKFSAEQDSALGVWRAVLFEHLCTAISLSQRVVIVTNSRPPWVSQCVAHFAPNILPLLEKIQVVYAREDVPISPKLRSVITRDLTSRSPHEMAGLQMHAKFVAMKKQTREFYSQYKGQTWKNIISIGDMAFERDALNELTFMRKSPAREQIRTKTWTVFPEPSIGRMIASLKRRTIFLPSVIHFNGDFEVTMNGSLIDEKHALHKALNIEDYGSEDEEFDTDNATDSLEHLEKLLCGLEGMVSGDTFARQLS